MPSPARHSPPLPPAALAALPPREQLRELRRQQETAARARRGPRPRPIDPAQLALTDELTPRLPTDATPR